MVPVYIEASKFLVWILIVTLYLTSIGLLLPGRRYWDALREQYFTIKVNYHQAKHSYFLNGYINSWLVFLHLFWNVGKAINIIFEFVINVRKIITVVYSFSGYQTWIESKNLKNFYVLSSRSFSNHPCLMLTKTISYIWRSSV